MAVFAFLSMEVEQSFQTFCSAGVLVRPSSLTVVAGPPGERLAKTTPKKGTLCWCGWTDAESLRNI